MKLIIITILLFVTPLWAHTLEMPTTTAMDNTGNYFQFSFHYHHHFILFYRKYENELPRK